MPKLLDKKRLIIYSYNMLLYYIIIDTYFISLDKSCYVIYNEKGNNSMNSILILILQRICGYICMYVCVYLKVNSNK